MLLRRISGPILPVRFDVIKRHCRVDSDWTLDDNLIMLYAMAAVRHGESLTGRVWGLSLFELETEANGNKIVLPRSPVLSVSKVSFKGESEEELFTDFSFMPSTILPDSNPFRDVGEDDPWLAYIESLSWPSSTLKISFSAGWEEPYDPGIQSPLAFPEDLAQWIVVKISSHYEQREDLASATRKMAIGFPRDFADSMLDPYTNIVRM